MSNQQNIFILIFFFSLNLYADLVFEIGEGSKKENAIENAKQKILHNYHNSILETLDNCKELVNDNVITADEDDYKLVFLKADNIKYSNEGMINLSSEFDIEPINNKTIEKLSILCKEEQLSRLRAKKLSDFMSQFNIGIGVSGWPPLYGTEVFFEYTPNKFYSAYITYSNHKYIQPSEYEEEQSGNIQLSGIQLRFLFFILGYEKTIKIKATENTIKEPSSAFIWGLVMPDIKKGVEYGLIFKNLNSEATVPGGGLTGGAFFRYKFF